MFNETLLRCLLLPAALWLTLPALAQQSGRDRFPHQFGYAPLSDGTELAYTLYRPALQGRFPTLLIYNMYDASMVGPDWNQTITPEIRDYLENGYAVMGANVRGSGCSTGRFDPLHAEMVGKDGAELVEWITRQAWSDGNVGMFGHSGSGITQFYVGAYNPRGLKAIIPGAAPGDFYRDLGYPGGLFNYSFMYMWAELAQPQQARRAAQAHIQAGDARCAELLKTSRPNLTYQEMAKRPYPSEWYAQRSINSVVSRIEVPTYIILGWQDQNLLARSALVFEQLQGPRKMLLAEGGHGLYINNMEVRREKLRFFDAWLKGRSNGLMEEKPVKVWYTMKGSLDPLPDRVGYYDTLPRPSAVHRLYLQDEGGLAQQPPSQASRLSYLYPAGGVHVYGPSRTPADFGSLVFKTAPLERDMTLLGPTQARLYISSTQPDTSFLAALHEIETSGRRTLLQRGYLRAALAEIDPARSTDWAVFYPFNREKPLAAGEVREIVIELSATGSIIERGHSLELSITAPLPAAEPLGKWGFMPLPAGVNTIHISPHHPSHIRLPLQE